MTLLIGTDEAGYGPNLGPLVVGLSAWQIPDDCPADQLPQLLRSFVAEPTTLNDPCRLPLADSKQLYQPQRGLAVLEQAVLAAWHVAGIKPTQSVEVWPHFAACEQAAAPRWHNVWQTDLPVSFQDPALTLAWRASFAAGLAAARIKLAKIQARLVQPAEFNRLVQTCGNKGTLLSETTLRLVRDVLSSLPAQDLAARTLVVCDKHGGRDRYAPVLQFIFPDQRLEVLREGRAESAYVLHGDQDQRIEFRFRTHGEEWLPTALASMTAKYLRELSMHAFNDFWQQHVPGVKPTAGYPSDAVRFRADIATAAKQLGVSDDELWRCR